MHNQVPASELTSRMNRFQNRMTKQHPEWKMAVIFSKINLLYFTGSMPDGMLIIQREGNNILWVRRSFERTQDESLFETSKQKPSLTSILIIFHFPTMVF